VESTETNALSPADFDHDDTRWAAANRLSRLGPYGKFLSEVLQAVVHIPAYTFLH
jgi:hypothetical protein